MTDQDTYRHLLDNISTALVVAEADLCISYVNSAAEVLLETSGKRVLGESIEHLFPGQDAEPVLLFPAM